jgi:large subunit ribosomal protein L24
VRIRKNDTVIILTGGSKGKTGRVLHVDTQGERVFVEGINVRTKHQRKTQRNPKGGVVKKESSVHISNVAPYNSETRKPARVGWKVSVDGGTKTKTRIDKRTGEEV